MTSSVEELSQLRRLFAHKLYASYMSGNMLALVGFWMQRLAIGWLAWNLTQSGFWLGIIAMVDFLPSLILGPLGGVIADRKSKRTIILIAQSLMTARAFFLAMLLALGFVSIWLLITISFVMGTAFALQESARTAIVMELVPVRDVPAAVAIGAVAFNAARFLGPALAGLLIINLSITFAVLAHGLLALALLLAILPVVPKRIGAGSSGHLPTSMWLQLREGIAVALNHQTIAPLLCVMLATTLLVRPAYELLPGIAEQLFGYGAGGLAAMTSSVGLGAVLAGVMIAQRGASQRFFRLALIGAAGASTALVVVVATQKLWIGLPALFALGFFMAVCVTSVQIVIQLSTEEGFRARVLSLWGLAIRGGPAVGALILGWLASYVGFPLPLFLAALICLMITALAFRRRRELNRSAGTRKPSNLQQEKHVNRQPGDS